MYDKFEEDDSSWSFALGLLVGAVVGAAVASLFTPRSGAQNREAVIERGLVLRDRVTDATDSVTTRVRDTATTVKDRAAEGAERIGAVAGATVERVQDAANTAAATVKDVAGTAAERAQTLASTATEKVQEAANTAAATVSEVAGTVSERAQDVAGTVSERAQDAAAKVQVAAGAAADRARQITGRESSDEFEIPAAGNGSSELDVALAEQNDVLEALRADASDMLDNTAMLEDTATLASEARYDAEDVRSAAVDADVPEQDQLDTLASIDTFDGATSGAVVEEDLVVEELPPLADEPVDEDLTVEELPPLADEPMDMEAGSDDAAVSDAQAELSSNEQFEVDEQAAPLGETTESDDDSQRQA